jgi:flagellar biosynthesis/type III secretory pathway protein FliH
MAKIIKAAELVQIECSPYQHSIIEPMAHALLDTSLEAEPINPHLVIEHARAEIEREAAALYAEMREKAISDGQSVVVQAADRCEQIMQAVAANVLESQNAFLSRIEGNLRDVVLALVRRIIRREVRTDPELILTAVRASLNEVADRRRIVLHLHPEDAAHIRSVRQSLLIEFDGIGEFEVREDSAIERGGSIIETDSLHVDARLQTQLDALIDTLFE